MIVGASRSVPAVVLMRPVLVTMPLAIDDAVFAESGTYSGTAGFSSSTVCVCTLLRTGSVSSVSRPSYPVR